MSSLAPKGWKTQSIRKRRKKILAALICVSNTFRPLSTSRQQECFFLITETRAQGAAKNTKTIICIFMTHKGQSRRLNQLFIKLLLYADKVKKIVCGVWYLNNHFKFHACLSVHPYTAAIISMCPKSSKMSQKSFLVCFKSEKCAFVVTFRALVMDYIGQSQGVFLKDLSQKNSS